MKYLLFAILLIVVLITAGCTSGNQNTVVTPTQTSQVQTIVVTPTSTTLSSSPILTPSPTQSMATQSIFANAYDRCEDAVSNVKSCSRGVETDKAYCNYWQMRVNASCSSTPSITSEPITDFKTFSNEEFSIQYPSFLTIDVKNITPVVNNPGDYNVDFLSSDKTSITGNYRSIGVIHSYKGSLSEYLQGWKNSGLQNGWVVVEQKPISIDGIEAYQSIETLSKNNYFGICRIVNVINKDTSTRYRMGFCNDPDKYFAQENSYVTMINSFKFVK